MLASYTITQDGLSNGNVIAQPFTIEIHKINAYSVSEPIIESGTNIYNCTKNNLGNACENDDIANFIPYPLQPMDLSNNDNLVATFEVTLTSVYGANWVKN